MTAVKVAEHGSRRRYRLGCRCVACSRSNYRRDDRPTDLRWPLKFLVGRHNSELVGDHISKAIKDAQGIDFYRDHGLADFEADAVAISLGDHPMVVWPGWIEAGLDNE